MFDYRLKVFFTVANRLSFTKAAEELSISQPAVTKHIRELESRFGIRFFDRKGNKIVLTQAGELLLNYAEQIRGLYRDLEFDLGQIKGAFRGHLRIGASTTIAQYVLPKILADFKASFQHIHLELLNNNTEKITEWLSKSRIDLGVVEGPTHTNHFDHIPFLKDEIVLLARSGHPLVKKTKGILPEDLYDLEFVFREQGSGTHETVVDALRERGIDITSLHEQMRLGSSEGIKEYLKNSDCVAFLSVNTALQELKDGTLSIIDIQDFSIERMFHFILPEGQYPGIIKLFFKFVFNK